MLPNHPSIRVARLLEHKAVIYCPYHDDRTPSAVVFRDSRVFYCSACNRSERWADAGELWGDREDNDGTLPVPPPESPTQEHIRLAQKWWNAPARGLDWQRQAFARSKLLPAEALEFARPHPKGLRFPFVAQVKGRLVVVGVLFRRKGVIPGTGPKTIAYGWRGFLAPPRHLRPAWWFGNVPAHKRVVVVTESVQAALKVALATEGQVLALGAGGTLSRWQLSVLADFAQIGQVLFLFDPDMTGKMVGPTCMLVDTDPLTVSQVRQLLKGWIR